jgi:hypothetical protein
MDRNSTSLSWRGDPDLTLFPNPAQSNVSMRYIMGSANGTIIVCDIKGAVEKSLPITQSMGSVEMDLVSLQEGVYFVKLKTDDSRQVVKKLVVLR